MWGVRVPLSQLYPDVSPQVPGGTLASNVSPQLCAYTFLTSAMGGSQVYFSCALSQVLPTFARMHNLSCLNGAICTGKVNLPLIAL